MKIKIKRIQSIDNRWVNAASFKVDEKLKTSFEASVNNQILPENTYVSIGLDKLLELNTYYNIEELDSLIKTNKKHDRYLITYFTKN